MIFSPLYLHFDQLSSTHNPQPNQDPTHVDSPLADSKLKSKRTFRSKTIKFSIILRLTNYTITQLHQSSNKRINHHLPTATAYCYYSLSLQLHTFFYKPMYFTRSYSLFYGSPRICWESLFGRFQCIAVCLGTTKIAIIDQYKRAFRPRRNEIPPRAGYTLAGGGQSDRGTNGA